MINSKRSACDLTCADELKDVKTCVFFQVSAGPSSLTDLRDRPFMKSDTVNTAEPEVVDRRYSSEDSLDARYNSFSRSRSKRSPTHGEMMGT